MLITKTLIAQQDEPFLFALYSDTRAEEMRLVPWDDNQKHAFLYHQFQAQHVHYNSKYKDGHFQIIKFDDIPVGRLYAAELDDEVRIIDITILSEFRGKNIGTTLIEEILRDANEKNKAVQIYLEANSQSVNLFARLGFVLIADEGIHQLWRKPAGRQVNSAKA